MKKVFAFLLVLVMSFSLIACGGNKDNAGKENANNAQTGTQTPEQPETPVDKQEPETGKMPEAEKKPEEKKEEPKPVEVPITLSHTDVTLFRVGETFRLSPRGITGTYAATFTSANEAIAVVDSNGIVSAVAPGTTKVEVHVEAGGTTFDGSCIIRCHWKEEAEQPAEQPEQPTEQPDNSQPEQTVPNGTNLIDFYTQVTAGYEFPFLGELTDDLLENFYPGMAAVPANQRLIMGCMMTMNNGEIGLVEVTNSADAETVKALFQARVDYMVDGGAFYPAATDQWANNNRVVSCGNFVMMVVHENCDEIVAAFNEYFG